MSICKLSRWEVPTGSQEWDTAPYLFKNPSLAICYLDFEAIYL